MRLRSLFFWRSKKRTPAVPPIVTAIIKHGIDARCKNISPDTFFVTRSEADEIDVWTYLLFGRIWQPIASGTRIYGVVIGVR